MSLRVYLDTSVFSAYFDERATDRQTETEAFWARRHGFEIATSELARAELAQASDINRRRRSLSLLKGLTGYTVAKDTDDTL